MGFARRTMRFGSGLALGAAVSSALSLLLAPRSGAELRAEITDRIEAAKRAGEEAELLEAERLKSVFRTAVNDPAALTGKYE
jgi:gas vesicle protein